MVIGMSRVGLLQSTVNCLFVHTVNTVYTCMYVYCNHIALTGSISHCQSSHCSQIT